MQRDHAGRPTSIDFEVDPNHRPLPLRTDLFLTSKLTTRSRSQIQSLFKEKRVVISDRVINASHKLKGGETVSILLSEDAEYIPPEAVDWRLVHEEEHFMVVNKGPNVMMHPAGSVLSGTLLNAVHKYFEDKGDPLRPGLIQRLDKNTSGLLVIAKTPEAHQDLQRQIGDHELDKIYLAFCEGVPQEEEGMIEAPLAETYHPFVKKMAIDEKGKASSTRYRVLAKWEDRSLCGVRLYTGRQHQIRVHMSHIGHPLVGDELYGGKRDYQRQSLHSYYLNLKHPVSNELKEFQAPLPEDLISLLDALGPPRSVDDNVDTHCRDLPWNPRTWLHKIHSS